jgi:hypothetical protein
VTHSLPSLEELTNRVIELVNHTVIYDHRFFVDFSELNGISNKRGHIIECVRRVGDKLKIGRFRIICLTTIDCKSWELVVGPGFEPPPFKHNAGETRMEFESIR